MAAQSSYKDRHVNKPLNEVSQVVMHAYKVLWWTRAEKNFLSILGAGEIGFAEKLTLRS